VPSVGHGRAATGYYGVKKLRVYWHFLELTRDRTIPGIGA
jgi:hypothetical protein